MAYACRGHYSYSLNVEHLYQTMPSTSSHPDTTPVVQIVQKQQQCRRLGNPQLPPARRHIPAPAGERDTSQGGSSIALTIHGQNSTPSSSLNNSGMADITQCGTFTPSATRRRSINSPTATPGTSSRGTPEPGGTSQADSTRLVVSCLTSGIASTPTPVSGHDTLPTPIPDREACAIITNPPRMRATGSNQRQRQWE